MDDPRNSTTSQINLIASTPILSFGGQCDRPCRLDFVEAITD
ncbi:hypothetical protein [Planktothricoides sp. SR001]|nr:hypothetical protein [Planktothricoides sp. SR001]